jgi:hypothetical protein
LGVDAGRLDRRVNRTTKAMELRIHAAQREQPMFVRIFRPKEDKEILLNTDHIWKIEVEYGVRSSNGKKISKVLLSEGINNPDAIRSYKVFFGNEKTRLAAEPNDPVMKVIEKIYNDAIKGGGKSKGSDPVS